MEIFKGDIFTAVGIDQSMEVLEIYISGIKISLLMKVVRNGFTSEHEMSLDRVLRNFSNENLYIKNKITIN